MVITETGFGSLYTSIGYLDLRLAPALIAAALPPANMRLALSFESRGPE